MSQQKPTEDTFIRLAALLRDDQQLGEFFTKLSSLNELQRNLKLTEMIETMKSNAAPKDMIETCKLLRKKEVFLKLQNLIKQKS
ncbi:MAG: hypothetical protein AB8G05_28025 [Oligoflexales bacterium]